MRRREVGPEGRAALDEARVVTALALVSSAPSVAGTCQASGMSARERVTRYWDDLLARWVRGDTQVPAELGPWFRSYRGLGRGEVVLDAFPEPYLGPLAGRPALAILGLNPGQAALDFQGQGGIFTTQIAHNCYSRWAAAAPYSSPEWEQSRGRNRYHRSRVRFAQALLNRDVGPEELLTVELYPWHSTAVTAPMEPPGDILDDYV